jgi:iron complex transport system substrate-binding protein
MNGARPITVCLNLAMLTLLLLAVACKPAPSLQPQERPQDALRIISLAPSITEILSALDAGELLVGRSMHCKYPPETVKVASVGRIDLPDLEKILALRPDSVILSALTPVEVEHRLRQLQLPTLRLQHSGLDGLRGDIETVAKHIGREQAGARFLSRWDQTIASVEAAVAQTTSNPPRIAYLYTLNTLYSAGRGSFIGDLIRLCGGYNIAEEAILPWPQLNRELILTANPEVILLALESDERSVMDRNTFIQQLQADPFWRQISAVQTARIHFIPADWLTVPGPRTLNAIEAIFAAIHQNE